MVTVKLAWLPKMKAYVVRCDDRSVGIVRFAYPIPFRRIVEII